MDNQGNMVQQKENNSPVSELKGTEYCNLTDKEFKIAVIKKLNELQENSGRQFSELRHKINEHKEFFTKDIQIIKITK